MKKIAALVLALVLLASCVSAVAEYDKHVSFTINAGHTNSDMDYNGDNLYKYVSEKFNFDWEVYPVSKDAQAEKIRTWINGGTMPDSVTIRDFNYQEYVTYGEQGLLASLPEGWEEKYPNLFWMVKTSGIYEQMKVDGLTYGIPHATFARFAGMDTVVSHLSVYYRKDWAEKLGIEIGNVCTIEQYENYLKACIDNDMAGNGHTLGFVDAPSNMTNFWMLFSGVDHDGFSKGENGYEWNFANPGVLEATKMAADFYKKGLIATDFYLWEDADAINYFTSGVAASMYINCAISSYYGYKSTFKESAGLDPNECIGITTIAANDGTTKAIQTNNWWAVTMFNPEIEPETLDRLLSMMDWLCTEEGQLTYLLGVPGETWQFGDNHEIVMLLEKDENGNYPATVDLYNSYNVLRTQGILADDYSFINPANDQQVVAEVLDMYATRQKGDIIMMDMDYEFFSSESKANFSLDVQDEFTRLVISKDIDIEAEWNKYIADNSALWQPVVDDLNAAFCK